MNDLLKGVYVARVTTESGTVSKKLMVRR
ncbi:MAG: hypothetical protein DRJ09_06370 [Bacteroidetes bacterium]|nr:MAG: hypothetical protein DRJ09_06370 [Bacteroidota bacterium]